MKARHCLLLLLLATVFVGPACRAQDEPTDYRLIHEVDTVWNFGYKGINLFSRPMHRIDIAYLSKNVEGGDVELSGYVCIPQDIYTGEQPCDGILLYNHFTQFSKSYAPTRGYSVGEDMVMANPLRPNYIVVCSDFLGFGITNDSVQAFCYNDVNGQANIDCFLAARKLLADRGIKQGKYVINAGYSSGGFDAVATQRVRDMKYKDQIVFHKTLCGGMPFDMLAAYDKFIEWKNDSTADPTCMPLMLGVYNHHAKLGYTPQQMFKEPFASKFEEWLMNGKYDNEQIKDSLKGLKLTDIMQDVFLDKSSNEYKLLKTLMQQNSLAKDWTPDSTQRYYVTHLLRDKVVPVEACRPFIYFLSRFDYDGKKCQGYERTIVPERTRLQTNFLVPSSEHTYVGGVLFYLNLAATLTATPVLYYDDELNTHYADLVEPATLMGIIHTLEDLGLDVRGIVQKIIADNETSTSGGIFGMLAQLEETFQKLGTSTGEVLTMAQDSGVELKDLIEVYTYLTTPVAKNDATEATRARGNTPTVQELEPCITGYYQHQLSKWLKENNVDLSETY